MQKSMLTMQVQSDLNNVCLDLHAPCHMQIQRIMSAQTRILYAWKSPKLLSALNLRSGQIDDIWHGATKRSAHRRSTLLRV